MISISRCCCEKRLTSDASPVDGRVSSHLGEVLGPPAGLEASRSTAHGENAGALIGSLGRTAQVRIPQDEQGAGRTIETLVPDGETHPTVEHQEDLLLTALRLIVVGREHVTGVPRGVDVEPEGGEPEVLLHRLPCWVAGIGGQWYVR